MAEAFQVVGGALACVDLAMKLYKEIERFRVRVRQADEVGEEMAAKYGRLTKTLDDVHSSLRCRKDQLGDRIPEEGEARIWVNIHDSLRGMKHALRKFRRELEILDKGRDVTVKRKWIDRAIWQLQLNKKEPVFDRLEEAATTHKDELTLSLHSLQIFMHSETSQYVQILTERITSIEASLRNASISQISPKSPRTRRTNRRQLQICLRAAHAIVDKKAALEQSQQQNGTGTDRRKRREPDRESIWETDAESLFEASASPPRRGTLLVPPDVNPDESAIAGIDESSPLFLDDADDEDDDSSSDDDDSLSDYSVSNESATTEITTDFTNDSQSEIHPRFYTAQNSLETETSRNSVGRTDSVVSHASSISFHNIDSDTANQLVKCIREKNSKSIARLLRGSIFGPEQANPSIRISKLPPIHYALKVDAGPDVIRTLANSTLIDVNAREPDDQMTALHFAVNFNRAACCAQLLSSPGIDIEAEDRLHRTPLALALSLSENNDADVYAVVKKLLDADATIPDKKFKVSGMVDGLLKRHRKGRRASSGTGTGENLGIGGSGVSLTKAKSNPKPERRGSEENGAVKRRWTLIQRSASAKG